MPADLQSRRNTWSLSSRKDHSKATGQASSKQIFKAIFMYYSLPLEHSCDKKTIHFSNKHMLYWITPKDTTLWSTQPGRSVLTANGQGHWWWTLWYWAFTTQRHSAICSVCTLSELFMNALFVMLSWKLPTNKELLPLRNITLNILLRNIVYTCSLQYSSKQHFFMTPENKPNAPEETSLFSIKFLSSRVSTQKAVIYLSLWHHKSCEKVQSTRVQRMI